MNWGAAPKEKLVIKNCISLGDKMNNLDETARERLDRCDLKEIKAYVVEREKR